MAIQLGFNLPARTALERDDFMIAPSNTVAVKMIDNWRKWPLSKLVLTGPIGAGKSHLTHVWASETGARIVFASELFEMKLDILARKPIAVEDVDVIYNDILCQTALFHLHNLLQSAGIPLLMTGIQSPRLWGLSLPDLQSRVDETHHASLEAPDRHIAQRSFGKTFCRSSIEIKSRRHSIFDNPYGAQFLQQLIRS